MNNRVLLVEDDKAICEMVSDYLVGEGFFVKVFYDGSTAIKNFETKEYDIALIDLMLSDVSGMDVIKSIRKISVIPIIIITAKDNDIDKSMGLNLGADDYVVKPFSLIELTARIKANIRRTVKYDGAGKEKVLKIKDLEINVENHTVLRDGQSLELTHIEFDILCLLASNPGKSFSKEKLYELVWKEPYYGNENVLNTHMNRLRTKLKAGKDEESLYIKTLWGIGYKMEETE